MYLNKTLLLVSFLAFTHALPNSPPDTCADDPAAYTLRVRRNHDVPEHLRGKKIEAAGLRFHIGLPGPATYCPVSIVKDCPPGNETVLAGLTSMDAQVPGGQRVYVEPAGSVGFTQAHSASSPPGSTFTGFTYCADSRTFGFQGKGFLACREEQEGVYKIFTEALTPEDKRDGCVAIGALHVRKYTKGFGAWQYT